MPPLDWSIVQSILLSLILPSIGAAAIVMVLACFWTRSETRRSTAASLALIAGLSAGLGIQNMKGELIPFSAVQRVTHSLEQDEATAAPASSPHWEIETGWGSLFSVALVAALVEIFIESLFRQRLRWRSSIIATGLLAAICAIWLTPWNLSSSHPWVCGILAMIILANWTTLRLVGQMKCGPSVPLTVAILWGGSAALVIVLSHSAKFADLAVLLSCALTGVGLVTVIVRQRLKTIFAGPATFVPGLMLADYLNTYNKIPVASFVIIAIAPGLLAFLHLPRIRAWFETRPIALAITFLIPCAIATGLAIRAEL